MSTPKVSVIIAAHSSQHKYVGEAIGSVNAQTLGPDNIEGILVSSREIIARDNNGSRYGYVRDLNQGVAMARNLGIRAAQAPLICCLDADDLLEPTYLERMVEMASKSSNQYVISSCDMSEFGARNGEWRLPEWSTKVQPEFNSLHCASVFSKALWRDAGGYPTDLCGWEDYGFWTACARMSPDVYHTKDKLFLYRVGENNTTEEKRFLEPYLRAAIYYKYTSQYSPDRKRWAEATATLGSMPANVRDRFERMPGFADSELNKFADISRRYWETFPEHT
jgi:glycosyltransferase involved in cell wall biosynthesis